ncbi:MAG: hypothetical protein WCA78_15675 [Rhizomicrobium sp.]
MSELVLVLGSRGSGKSTKARELTARAFRRVVLDPSKDWQAHGVRAVRSLPDLSKLIAARWRDGFDCVYTPPAGHEAIALHHLSNLVLAYQEKFYRLHHEEDEVTIVVDEMAEAYGNDDARRQYLSGFRRVILQGRHFGVSVVGISQRPADVAARYRDNCPRWYAFQLHDHTSRETVLQHIGPEYGAQYRALARFEFLVAEEGRVSKGKTAKR